MATKADALRRGLYLELEAFQIMPSPRQQEEDSPRHKILSKIEVEIQEIVLEGQELGEITKIPSPGAGLRPSVVDPVDPAAISVDNGSI